MARAKRTDRSEARRQYRIYLAQQQEARAAAEAAAVGRPDLKPLFSAERPGDVPRLWVDPAKLRGATSFKPRTRPAEGLVATVEYYRELLRADPGCLSHMQTRNWEVA